VRHEPGDVLEAAAPRDLVDLLVRALEDAALHRERLLADAAEQCAELLQLRVVRQAPPEIDALRRAARTAGAEPGAPRPRRRGQGGALGRRVDRGAQHALLEPLLDTG